MGDIGKIVSNTSNFIQNGIKSGLKSLKESNVEMENLPDVITFSATAKNTTNGTKKLSISDFFNNIIEQIKEFINKKFEELNKRLENLFNENAQSKMKTKTEVIEETGLYGQVKKREINLGKELVENFENPTNLEDGTTNVTQRILSEDRNGIFKTVNTQQVDGEITDFDGNVHHNVASSTLTSVRKGNGVVETYTNIRYAKPQDNVNFLGQKFNNVKSYSNNKIEFESPTSFKIDDIEYENVTSLSRPVYGGEAFCPDNNATIKIGDKTYNRGDYSNFEQYKNGYIITFNEPKQITLGEKTLNDVEVLNWSSDSDYEVTFKANEILGLYGDEKRIERKIIEFKNGQEKTTILSTPNENEYFCFNDQYNVINVERKYLGVETKGNKNLLSRIMDIYEGQSIQIDGKTYTKVFEIEEHKTRNDKISTKIKYYDENGLPKSENLKRDSFL